MSLIRLFKMLIKRSKWQVLSGIMLSVITIMSSVALFALSAYVISFCALHPSVADIAVAVVGVRFFGISRGGFRYLERLVSHNTTFGMLSNLRVWIYQKIEAMDMYKYITMDKQDVFTRIIDDVEILQEFYLRTFTPFLVSILVGISGFIMLMFFDKSIALGFLAFYLCTVLTVPILLWSLTKGLYKSLVLEKSALKVKFLDFLEGLDEILGNSAQDIWRNNLEASMLCNEELQTKIALWRSISSSIIMLLTNLAMITCLVLGISLVHGGGLNGVYLAVIALTTSSLFEGAQGIPVMLQKIEQSKAAGDRIFEITNMENENILEEIEAGTSPVTFEARTKLPPRELEGAAKIEFKGVSFSYPGQNTESLKDICFKAEVGKKIAIVGASGSGKTTLSYLMLNWLSCSSGTVEIDNYNIKNISKESITKLFSVVNQKVYFFNTSIRNNLKIGNPNASTEELDKALGIAQISELVKALPEGFDTELGEGGMKLSGGERQRLAIARALLLDRPFIILDEPTAGLDMTTEKNLLSALYENTQDKGLIIITHRLVAMEKMDEILVINKGIIVERGSHESLMEQSRTYKKLWLAQRQYVVN